MPAARTSSSATRVSGSVTLRLQNVPWDQALDIVLRTKGLDKRQEGNVIIVAPADELAAREKAELAAKQGHPGARAAALGVPAGQLRQGGRHGARCSRDRTAAAQQLGAVAARQRRRSMTAPTRCCCRTPPIGSPTSAAWWRRSTSRSRQVLIEARIVIVNNDFERDLGALLRRHRHARTTAPTACMRPPAPPPAPTRASARRSPTSTTNGTVYPVSIPTGATAANRYNVNLPVATPAGSIALGILGSDFLVDLELSAAQAKTAAPSSPRRASSRPTRRRPRSSRVSRSRTSSPPRAARPRSSSRRRCCRSRSSR